MKPTFIPIAVAAGLLLAATNSGWALPPRQHSVNGVVDAIDCASRTITLKSKDGAAPLTFVWNDSTCFTKKGGCAKCSFDSGQTVHVWYRREVGQNVIREVSTSDRWRQSGGQADRRGAVGGNPINRTTPRSKPRLRRSRNSRVMPACGSSAPSETPPKS